MVAPDGTVNPAIGGWSEALEPAPAYRRSLCPFGSQRASEALPARLARAGGTQERPAAGRGHRRNGPPGVQRLLNSAKWDADAVREDLGGTSWSIWAT